MPAKATLAYFRERKLKRGEVYEIEENGLEQMMPVTGIDSALVPGMVDAVLLALSEYGTLTFADVVQPALELAENGIMDERCARELNATRRVLEMWPTSKAVFLPDGRVPRAGEVFRQTDLARTLRLMMAAEQGKARTAGIEAVRDLFYRGDIARRIAAFAEAEGGLLRYEDLAGFRVEVEEPLAVPYHGYTVYKPGFWSQGPSLIQVARLLDGMDLAAWNSAQYVHASVEAWKLAYADRDTWYGDPRFVKPPVELLSAEYARQRRALVTDRASMEFRPGLGGDHPSAHIGKLMDISDELMQRDTTCVAAADRDGVMFVATPSGAWTPALIAGDTGIPLTQRAQSFLLLPGHPNVVAGGKRPRVTLSPTLVTMAGRAYLAIATPGGDNQEQSQWQVMLNVLDFGMNAQQAVEAPRFQTRHLVSSFDNHGMAPGEVIIDERMGQRLMQDLTSRGHKVEMRTRYGSGAAPVAIRVLANGVIEAGADPIGFRSARAW